MWGLCHLLLSTDVDKYTSPMDPTRRGNDLASNKAENTHRHVWFIATTYVLCNYCTKFQRDILVSCWRCLRLRSLDHIPCTTLATERSSWKDFSTWDVATMFSNVLEVGGNKEDDTTLTDVLFWIKMEIFFCYHGQPWKLQGFGHLKNPGYLP